MPGLMVLLVAGVLACCAGYLRVSASRPRETLSQKLMKTSRDDLVVMLRAVETADEPPAVMGAMCYRVATLPEVVEYVCPVCGEKTVYPEGYAPSSLQDLEETRAEFAALDAVTEIDISLDETPLCGCCGAADSLSDTPRIVVRYPDGSEYVTTLAGNDLQVLRGFLSGGLSWETDTDGLLPIKPHLERIRTILGLADR